MNPIIISYDDMYNNDYLRAVSRAARKTQYGENGCRGILKIGAFKSVIDLGCGPANVLGALSAKGVEVCGVDGAKAAIRHLCIPEKNFILHDLRTPFTPPHRFDFCLSTEVAEHLPIECADIFIDSLARCSDNILLTAAQPYQVTLCHLNLQPREYWIDKMVQRGYSYSEDKTNIWRGEIKDPRSIPWRDNAMYFEKKQ